MARFFFQYSCTSLFLKEIENHSLQFATPKKINLGNIGDVLIYYPRIEAEQTAIAKVLTSMDSEIASLEAKKAKYETIKHGMMQQLLTGKIRLI